MGALPMKQSESNILKGMMPEELLYLFNVGKNFQCYNLLGAHEREVNGEKGFLFAVWAPNA